MDYERRLAISAWLLEQVRMARAEYDAANAYFTNVVKDVPSGLPASDGALRMQLAGQDSRRTLRNYMDALRRFSDYTLRDIVPEEYQKPD
jgi:TolA-binding protein